MNARLWALHKLADIPQCFLVQEELSTSSVDAADSDLCGRQWNIIAVCRQQHL